MPYRPIYFANIYRAFGQIRSILPRTRLGTWQQRIASVSCYKYDRWRKARLNYTYSLLIFMCTNFKNYYSCCITTATIEYSPMFVFVCCCVCVHVCGVCMCVACVCECVWCVCGACVCVCVCVCVHNNSKSNDLT